MSEIEYVEKLPPPPPRPSDGNKGTFGSVFVIAGSEGMSGAACLAGYGALRGGAGLVTLAVPRCVASIVASVEPSWLTMPLPCDDQEGKLSKAANVLVDKACNRQTVVAMGPGLGQSAGVKSIVEHVYRTCTLPLVLDADGLNAFAQQPEKLAERETDAPRILTPHPGEFSRLTGIETEFVQVNRESLASEFAARHNVVVVLKGARTVVSDGKKIAINQTGNSGMATGGAGDVLTGLIASLIGQRMDPFDAAQLGVHLHGLAGEFAAQKLTKPFICASDIHGFMHEAWRKYLAEL